MGKLKTSPFDQSYYYGAVYDNYDDFVDFSRLARDLYEKYNFTSFLDIGCGCGNLPIAIDIILSEKKGGNYEVQGVDISEFAVSKANKPYINVADCRNLSMFGSQHFDVVHILGTFSYLSDIKEIKKAMREAYRVSKMFIVFDDVYEMPPKTHDDYDPHRVRAYSQKEWGNLWKEIANDGDSIEFNGDEVVIQKIR